MVYEIDDEIFNGIFSAFLGQVMKKLFQKIFTHFTTLDLNLKDQDYFGYYIGSEWLFLSMSKSLKKLINKTIYKLVN